MTTESRTTTLWDGFSVEKPQRLRPESLPMGTPSMIRMPDATDRKDCLL
jgi:hypothetical protein